MLLAAIGFDNVADAAGLGDLFSQVGSSGVTLEASGGAFGGKFMRHSIESQPGAANSSSIDLPAASNRRGAAITANNAFRMAMWIRVAATATDNEHIVGVESATDGHDLILYQNATTSYMSLRQYDNTTGSDLVNTGVSIADGAWHHYEIRFIVSTSSVSGDGEYAFWFDGSLLGSSTGANTQGGGSTWTNELDQVWLTGGRDNNNVDYDDILIWDEEGSGLITSGQLGIHRLSEMVPTADGNSSDFTPKSGVDNYAMVDEDHGHDTDGTENTSATLNHQDLFDMSVV